MSSSFGGTERPGAWQTLGDLMGRIRILEAVDPCDCEEAEAGQTYSEVVGLIDVPYAWYKLPETGTEDWLDYSGGDRHLDYVDQTGTVRGVVGVVDEDDGTLGVELDGGTPSAGKDETYIGTLADDFFRFPDTDVFTVIGWVKPGFNDGTSATFQWGIIGTALDPGVVVDNTDEGWAVYVEPTTLRIDFRRGLSPDRNRLRSVGTLVADRWTMFACVWTGSAMKIYLDGELDNSGLDSSGGSLTPYDIPSNGSNFLQLGSVGSSEGTGTNSPWVGLNDSFIVAQGDLSNLIASLYAAGPGLSGPSLPQNPVNGQTHFVRVGDTPYEFIRMTYDGTYDKWVSDPEMIGVQAPADGVGTTSTTYVTMQATATLFPRGNMIREFRALYDSGLRLQVRFGGWCNGPAGQTTSFRVDLGFFDDSETDPGVQMSSADPILTFSGTSAVNRVSDWSDFSGSAPGKDHAFIAAKQKVSGGTAPTYRALNLWMRWVADPT